MALSFRIAPDGVSVNRDKIAVILDMPLPHTKGVESLLSRTVFILASLQRTFVKTDPIRHLRKADQAFH
jgi:hypothetical protein